MKSLSRFFAFLFAALITQSALGQAWPSKPLRLIVTFPPGGTSDIAARLVGERLGARLGQSVIVDNRPGVAGILGTEAGVKSAPDGYPLVLTSTAPIAFAPSTGKPLSYDPAKDLAHVAILGTIPLALIVPVESPAKSAADIAKMAREKPNALNFSSSGNATPSHLMLERFK